RRGWRGLRILTRFAYGALHRSRSLRLGDVFAALWIERGKVETVRLAKPVNEYAHTGHQGVAITAAGNLLANALAHFTDQTFRQIDAGAAGDLTEEPAVVRGDHDQQTSIHTGRRADFPI